MDNKIGKMFCVSQQSHHDFILRSARNIDQDRRKFSASYKKRNRSDRDREKKTNSKLLHYPSEEVRPKQHQQQELASCIRKQSLSGLEEKTASHKGESRQKHQEFSIIMESIKDVLRCNEKQSQEAREVREFRSKFNLKDEFLCLRSKLHQQLYRSELREEHRSRQFEQSLLEMKRYTRNEAANSLKKYTCNPFMAANTVVCSSAVLNEPLPKKQPQLQLASGVSASKSFYRRSPQVPQSLQKKMGFQLSVNEGDVSYCKKIRNYLQFLFKVNFSNCIYANLDIRYEEAASYLKSKVFIGQGNNALLVRNILKRRFWWEVASSIDEPGISFYWTQGKLDHILASQKSGRPQKPTLISAKRSGKISEEAVALNRKILSEEKAQLVEHYVCSEGFSIPFEEVFAPDVMSNHLPRNDSIGSKKNLFRSLFLYYKNVALKDPFDFLPKTYHVRSRDCPEFQAFLAENCGEPGRLWIVKPGENTNRGKAIELCSFSRVEQSMGHEKHQNGEAFTYIIQAYINRPLLYNNRKFDLRHYLLLTSVRGCLKAYWYREGYIRTSSEQFDLENLSKFVHLTNDAIQKHCENYQKHEPANKLAYSEFQRYLDFNFPNKGYHLERDILSRMKQMAVDIVRANYLVLDHHRHSNNFELFGLDFMIDRDWKPWLIEVNYNPCLEVNCPVLERVIPTMLENTFRLALDPLFPPPCHFPSGKRFYLSDNHLRNLKYELIFDEETLPNPIKNPYCFEDDPQEQELTETPN